MKNNPTNPVIPDHIKEDLLRIAEYDSGEHFNWLTISFLSLVVGAIGGIIGVLLAGILQLKEPYYVGLISGAASSAFAIVSYQYDRKLSTNSRKSKLLKYFERIEGDSIDPIADKLDSIDEDTSR